MGVIPTRMMPMGAWRKSAPPLPYDAEVEYVESTGAQYVDTGIATGNNELDFEIVCKNMNSGTLAGFFGCRNEISGNAYVPSSYSAFLRSNSGGDIRADIANNGSAAIAPLRSSTEYSVAWSAATRTLAITNLNSAAAPLTLTANTKERCDESFALFAVNTGGTFGAGAPARIYSATFSRAGVLVRDFIPVRVGTVGYLYDRSNPTGGPLGNGLYGSETATPLVAGLDK